MKTLDVVVARRTVEAQDIVALELRDPAGAALPPWTAGAHIDVHLAPGLVRQYSLCGAVQDRQRYRIAVLREEASRGGSATVHAHVHEGDRLRIGEPRNLFALERAPHTLLFAGGIGVTPILAMAQELCAQDRSFALHYGVRSAARAAFRREIEQSRFAARVSVYCADEPRGLQLDVDAVLRAALAGTHLYVCGPAGFIAHVREAARGRGWGEQRIHSESFGAAPVACGADRPFRIRLAASGRSIEVGAGESAAAALLREGVAVPLACEQGICGTCVTRVLDGEPDHRDLYLTPQERARNDQFTPCCSRARASLLVLDL
jgi:vanillate monooxygenase ferredoxin subunit